MHNYLFRENNILGDSIGWIELVNTMPVFALDRAVVNAARVSHLGDSKGDEADWRLLHYLYRNRHTTPFEQVQFKFRIKAPVVVFWQLVRHRTMSFNLQSGRHTKFEDEFYVPKEWRLQSKSNKQGSNTALPPIICKDYSDTLEQLIEVCYKNYRIFLDAGIAKEQARLVLPAWASYYTGVFSVNAHNLMHFLRLRMAEEAQWEIRQYANAMHTMFAKVMPQTAGAFNQYG